MKTKVGFLLPDPLIAAYEDAAERLRLGHKEKWLAISSAILMFIEASESERQAFIEAASGAAHSNGAGFPALIERVRSGEFRDAIKQREAAGEKPPKITSDQQRKARAAARANSEKPKPR